ncbi:MAG: hypothetical protein K5739_08900 [Lachnospiraceae bacterium]|nr:hypothetical protein [Lachnospiraceae bacterium]
MQTGVGDNEKDLNNTATTIPFMSEGASMNVVTNAKNTTVRDVLPLYQLTEIRLTAGEDYNELMTGDAFNLSAFQTEGYNDYNVPFNGYDPDEGYWALCDVNGNVLQSSELAEIVVNPATGRTSLKAKKAGEVYIKWLLSDDAEYNCIHGQPVSAKFNQPKYPIVEFVISEASEDLSGYRVETKPTAAATVGEGLNLTNAVSPVVYDNEDRIVSRAATFENRDLTSNAAVIDDNGVGATVKVTVK